MQDKRSQTRGSNPAPQNNSHEIQRIVSIRKIAKDTGHQFCRAERHNVAIYLNALRRNDRAIIEEYESFGNTPRQLLMNKREYERHLVFGFIKRNLTNTVGWKDLIFGT